MQQVGVYRPNSNIEKGAAFQFKFGYKKDEKTPALFIAATVQTKPKPEAGSTESPFSWTKEHKITIMLNVHEVGQLNALISRLGPYKLTKFIHDTDSGMKNLQITPPSPEQVQKFGGNWGFSLQHKEGDNTRKVQCFVDPGELYQIKLLGDIVINAYLRAPNAFESKTTKSNG